MQIQFDCLIDCREHTCSSVWGQHCAALRCALTPRVAAVQGSTGNKGAAWGGRGSGVRCSSQLRTNSLLAGDTAETESVESKLLLIGLGMSEVRLRQLGLTFGPHWTDAMLVPFSSD